MTGKKTLLILLILFTTECEFDDFDGELVAPQVRTWRAYDKEQLEITTFSGDISLTAGPAGQVKTEIDKRCLGGEAQDAEFTSSEECEYGADFDITVPDSVSVNLKNANGDISVTGLAAEAKLATTNGNVVASDFKGSVDAQVTNGNLECSMVVFGGAQSATLSSINGNVTLLLPADVSAVFDASAVNGKVTVSGFGPIDFVVDESSHKAGTIGSGLARIKIQSTNGDVQIRPC